MKILKMYVARKYGNVHYYCLFDEMPEITYEKIGTDFVGSAVDDDGDIIFSHFLHKGSSGAFGGRELALTMKDGSTQKIKDYWWDNGYYRQHGEFVDIGAGTLEELQECYVYYGCNINKVAFQKMLDDYYSREKEYAYYDIEAWANMQYTWYPVMIDGKVFEPLMVNEKVTSQKEQRRKGCIQEKTDTDILRKRISVSYFGCSNIPTKTGSGL